MSDIKLFQLQGYNGFELTGSAAKIEKSLQEQIEMNLIISLRSVSAF